VVLAPPLSSVAPGSNESSELLDRLVEPCGDPLAAALPLFELAPDAEEPDLELRAARLEREARPVDVTVRSLSSATDRAAPSRLLGPASPDDLDDREWEE